MTAWWCLVVGPLLASALWLWWEYRHAVWVDADEQPIDTIPHVDPDYLLEHDRAVRAIQERAASVADPGALLRVIKADGS